VWANQKADDLAVVNADDPVAAAVARSAPARVTTFGLGEADWHVDDDRLLAPEGQELIEAKTLDWRPHDLSNALAAAAAATAMGATLAGTRAALLAYPRLPHRVALVGEAGGVRWYDDSKATNPHAAIAAIGGFPSVVLIAGGRNKGLDLAPLARETTSVRAVVAIGEAAGDIEAAFAGHCPVKVAASMDEAVDAAAELATSGDAVLLSPACASYDWYGSYAERGDDFARAVRRRLDLDG
jgi:UDP-N-acetylmuramoylalanine--D-glutamate ligase